MSSFVQESCERRSPAGLFVTGTDTGVGKTVVSCAILEAAVARGLRAGAIKPVSTGGIDGERDGCLVSEDGELLRSASGRGDAGPERFAPLVFRDPLAPPAAARAVGLELSFARVVEAFAAAAADWIDERLDVLVVEGVGGLYCPIAEHSTVADLACMLDYPLIIVARRDLGTLNHTIMTIELAKARGLRIAGVILNDAEEPRSWAAAARCAEDLVGWLGEIPILGAFGHQPGRSHLRTRLRDIDLISKARASRRNWDFVERLGSTPQGRTSRGTASNGS